MVIQGTSSSWWEDVEEFMEAEQVSQAPQGLESQVPYYLQWPTLSARPHLQKLQTF